jgi:glutamine cyclotransferase
MDNPLIIFKDKNRETKDHSKVQTVETSPNFDINTNFAASFAAFDVIKSLKRPSSFSDDYDMVRFYTQGITFYEGYLLESTGMAGYSRIRLMSIREKDTHFVSGPGMVIKETSKSHCDFLSELRPDDNSQWDQSHQYCMPFTEGVAVYGEQAIQLTWQMRLGIVYDIKKIKDDGIPYLDESVRFDFPIEGWGLTSNNDYLIFSDGSHRLYFVDPKKLGEIKKEDWNGACVKMLKVFDGDHPPLPSVTNHCDIPQYDEYESSMTADPMGRYPWVGGLNELEYAKGKIYSNILGASKIVVINPENGRIESWLDLRDLQPNQSMFDDEEQWAVFKDFFGKQNFFLNGIAYDKESDHFYLTGKQWPIIYQIKIK